MSDSMQRLIRDLNNGKMRGYSYYTHPEQSSDTTRNESGSGQLIQYAVQKRNHRYVAYYFQVDVDQMDNHEEAAVEQYEEYSDVEQALACLVKKGADLDRFAPFKGQTPF